MNYLFDTNVWVAIQRGESKVRDRWRQQDVDSVFLCSPVVAELFQGAMKSAKRRENMKFVDDILFQHDCLVFGIPEAARYAEIANAMYANKQSGKVMDLQIGAIALVHGLRVVTHDVLDFGRIPSIDFEDSQT